MILPQKPLKTSNRAKSLWYKVGLLVLLALALLIAWKAYAYTTFLTQDWETFNLGAVQGQQSYMGAGTIGNALPPYSYPVKSGEKSCYGGVFNYFDYNNNGISSFWIYFPASMEGWASTQFKVADHSEIYLYYGNCTPTYCEFWISGEEAKRQDINTLTWNSFQVRWLNKKYQYNINNAGWSGEINFADTYTANVNQMYFTGPYYVDKIGGEISTEPQIIATSPASATTITDLSTNLIFDYLNLDWDTYDGFIINFEDSKGVRATSKLYEEADLDPSGSGSETLPLSDFEIDQNGNWYLTGYAYGTTAQFGGNPPVLYGTIDIYSDELVLDNYYLNFNVEGLSEPYTFASSTDWYSENVERFASSTPMFSAFIGLLSPIFEKVADFGTRVQGMFNQTEAYDRGFSLGEVFPILNGYVAKIDKFFGSFPLVSFLKYTILVMLGIFIVRAVIKFIPFFG